MKCKKIITLLTIVIIILSCLTVSAINVFADSTGDVDNNKVYYIKNRKSGLYLTYNSNGILTQQTYTGAYNQQWKVSNPGGINYDLITTMDPTANPYTSLSFPKSGTNITAENNTGTNQCLSIQLVRKGYFKIVYFSVNALCVSIENSSTSNGAKTIASMYSDNGDSDSDHWSFEVVETPEFQNSKYSTYVNIASGDTIYVRNIVCLNYHSLFVGIWGQEVTPKIDVYLNGVLYVSSDSGSVSFGVSASLTLPVIVEVRIKLPNPSAYGIYQFEIYKWG